MARNPLIHDLDVALPSQRRSGSLDIEALPTAKPPPKPDHTLVNFPKLPWTCQTCEATLESTEAFLTHSHEWQGPTQPAPKRLPAPPWICPRCSARLESAEAMLAHNHGLKRPG